jgi:hypothetical protein
MKSYILILAFATLSFSVGRSHWVEKYPTPLNDTVLSNFDGGVGTEWAVTSGDSAVNDLVNVRNGTQSIRSYCSGSTNTAIRKTIPATDLSKYDFFTLTFHIDDYQKYQVDSANAGNLWVVFGTSTGNHYSRTIITNDINAFGDGWYKVNMYKNALAATGSPAWTNITYISVYLLARNLLVRNITIDQLKAGSSPITKGGVILWFDTSNDSTVALGKQLFDRYGMKFTMSAKPGETVYTTDSSKLQMLQNEGHDIVVYPWSSTNLTALTVLGVDTQVTMAKNYHINNGFRGNTIMAFSQAAHDRKVDSICNANGFEWGRGSGINAYKDVPHVSYAILPAYDNRYNMGMYTYYNSPLDTLKMCVDSAAALNLVNIIVINGVTTSVGVSTVIDTGKLDSLLKYCDSLTDAGVLGYAGKFTNYLLYAPDSCIENKVRNAGVITDSISLLADSMKIILYDSTATGWDTVAISPMLRGGSLHTFTTATWSPGLYRLREWGITNSGTVDSGLAAFDYVVAGAFDTTGLITGLFRQPQGTASKNTGTIIPVRGPAAPDTIITATLESMPETYGWREDLGSYKFNKISTNIVFSKNIGDIITGGKFSVAGRMKTASFTGQSSIWGKVLSGTAKIVVHYHNNDTFQIRLCNGNAASTVDFIKPAGHGGPDEWFNLVVSIDVTQAVEDRIKVYVDGIACVKGTIGLAEIPNAIPDVRNTTHRFGGWGSTAPTTGIDGEINYMLLFNRALPLEEAINLTALGSDLGGLWIDSSGGFVSINITTQPENDTTLTGLPGTFTVGYTGEDVQVAWYKNNVFTGITTDTLRITGSNGDSVQAVLWNGEDTVSSSMAYLTVVGVPIDTIKISSFDLVNSSGNMFPVSGWTIAIVRAVGDTLSTTIARQDEYGFGGIVPSEPLAVRRTPYPVLFTNGVYTIVKSLRLSGTSAANGRNSLDLRIGIRP